APLRDKVTSSAQPLVPSGQPSLSILTEPRDELAPFHSITSSARARTVHMINKRTALPSGVMSSGCDVGPAARSADLARRGLPPHRLAPRIGSAPRSVRSSLPVDPPPLTLHSDGAVLRHAPRVW